MHMCGPHTHTEESAYILLIVSTIKLRQQVKIKTDGDILSALLIEWLKQNTQIPPTIPPGVISPLNRPLYSPLNCPHFAI